MDSVSQEFGKGTAGTFLCPVTYEASAGKAQRLGVADSWELTSSQGVLTLILVLAWLGATESKACQPEYAHGPLHVTGLLPAWQP